MQETLYSPSAETVPSSTSGKTKGIVLFAFGKSGYVLAAFNLAMSIKKHSDIPIALFVSEKEIGAIGLEWLQKFCDHIEILEPDTYMLGGKIDPAVLKCEMYDYLPFDQNLCLDVDSLCIKSLDPLMDYLNSLSMFYVAPVLGQGGKKDDISYSLWAKNEDIWEHFKLPEGATLPALQTSWCYIEKCEEAKAFFSDVKANRDFPMDKLKMKWGGTLPDELIYSGTCAQHGMIPKCDKQDEVYFFGNVHDPKAATPTMMESNFYFMSIYGPGKGKPLVKLKYLEWYDRYVLQLSRQFNAPLIKRQPIMRDKHLNNK